MRQTQHSTLWRHLLIATLWILIPNAVSAQQATTGFYDTKPVVLLVLDSSGSMSYVAQELVTPVCTTGDVKESSTEYSYSRGMVAAEVLTGTFNGFWCKEEPRPTDRHDANYPIPWFVPQYSSQDHDGIIDVNKERIKFGLMTFDTILGAQDDQAGGWSTGPNALAVSGVGITNLGVQNDEALLGQLVIPSSADDFTSILTNNALVQEQILKTVPFGGTPISPALADVYWLLKNHPSLQKKTSSNNGDPYATCRTKNVLLLTDGRPTMGESEFGYTSSIAAAETLFKSGYKVYVVGFNLSGDTSTIVNDIAEAGGTVEAYTATTPAQLATALSSILGKATPGVHSRTNIAATNHTNSATDLQYQINTAYSASLTSDIDATGYFEVTAYRCEEACQSATGGAGPCVVTNLRPLINNNNSRNLFVTIDGQAVPLSKAEIKVNPETMDIPTAGLLPEVKPTLNGGILTTSGGSLGDASSPANRLLFLGDLIDFLHGKVGTRREYEHLGGIWHSTPVVQTNLSNIDVQIPSFTAYKQAIADRPTMAYFATHDGFVHAVHVSQPGSGSPTGTKWLDEVWGIAPQNATKQMHKLVSELKYLLDGTPVLKDIRLRKSAADISVEDDLKQWRSVLVVPYRVGGRGMFAIDVTDPFNPFVRWEIDNKRHCWRGTSGDHTCKTFEDGTAHDFRNLGYTHGKPKIGTVFIKTTGGGSEETAAVFFPCGDGVTAEPESGKCFMVVRLDTGEKIKEFKNGDESVVDGNTAAGNVNGLEFDVVGSPAAYNTFVGTFVTRLFVGDEGGQLWRIDVSDRDPGKWKMTFFFDPYDDAFSARIDDTVRSPLTSEPALSPVPQRGQVVVVFGTGDLDYATDLSQRTLVYSVKETLKVNSASGGLVAGGVNSEVNWRTTLNEGENLTSRPIVFANVTYFTSFQPDKQDACLGGTGRIWGVDFLASDGTDPVARFDKDGSTQTTDDVVKFIELEDSIPYGINLISRPSCAGESGVEQAAGSSGSVGSGSALLAAKPGQLELVVQTGNSGQTSQNSLPAKGGKGTVNKVHRTVTQPPKQVLSVSWGQIQSL